VIKAPDQQINEQNISISHKDEYVVTRYFFIYNSDTPVPAVNGFDLYRKYANRYF
jgi:hypothetical protein